MLPGQDDAALKAAADGSVPANGAAGTPVGTQDDAVNGAVEAVVEGRVRKGSVVPAGGKTEPAGNVNEDEQTVFGKLDFQPDFKALMKGRKPTSLRWENVYFAVGGRDILKRVDGQVGHNQLCALMGPSGAGKSSLLNTLAGRMSSSKNKELDGSMYVNDEKVNPIKFRRHVAYVLQQDSLVATATALESLEFSARLRLPQSTSSEERTKLVEDLLKSLGLWEVKDTMCGNEMIRGLSGGEMKRVSIGVELVTNPQVLFLDEPTSGLDSYSAFAVVTILKALARSGCAVLCTIHQPSSEIFNLFDKAVVLANGRVMYNGRVKTLPANFERAGLPVPPLTNPADFVMVLSQTKSEKEMPCIDEEKPDHVPVVVSDDARAESSMGVGGTRDGSSIVVPTSSEIGAGRQAPLGVQLEILTIREFRNLFRDKPALIARFGITIFLNVLFGLIFLGAGDVNASEWNLNGHFGALTNCFISALFGAAQPPLLTFPLERVAFLREYSTGTYSGTPYFFSKVMVELPLYFVTSLVILLIQYWMVQFQGNFMILTLEIFLIQIVSASYAFLAGALVNNVQQAQEMAPLIFVPQLLFVGFFRPLEDIPVYIRWVQYLCSLKYGLNLAMISEFGGDRCAGDDNPPAVQTNQTFQCQQLLIGNDADEDLVGFYVGMLIAIFVLFRSGSLVALIYRAKNFTT
ncbi:ATP-binding cassette sub-family G member 4 [Durusdinium trenchii]|uniref:ATP-binding cassette sub-family G member 4 n=1 Tax=Durusdinium trenchii TaxID=1381693 RepID=A0ABP0RUE4_9DINO